MKPLIIIPARGKSKGIPDKNIKLLNGVPLIHYTVKAAQEVFGNEQICVSTDDSRIKCCVEELALTVPFLRPSELATDTSATYDVLLYVLAQYEHNGYNPDVIIVLQPTSPFRNATHIREAVSLFNYDLDMVVSVKETRSNPYYVLFEEDEDGFLKKSKQSSFTRRQDCPKVWEYNGAIYVINVASLNEKPVGAFDKIIKYEMDEVSSLDLDTPFDWYVAETVFKTPLK